QRKHKKRTNMLSNPSQPNWFERSLEQDQDTLVLDTLKANAAYYREMARIFQHSTSTKQIISSSIKQSALLDIESIAIATHTLSDVSKLSLVFLGLGHFVTAVSSYAFLFAGLKPVSDLSSVAQAWQGIYKLSQDVIHQEQQHRPPPPSH
ncbi:MAG: hypothetical protein AAGJ35_09830, partial [Myxococcota bacterium]